jgi:hypothetical protein
MNAKVIRIVGVAVIGMLVAGAAMEARASLLDDHFDNNNLGTDVNGVNGGFQRVSNGVGGNGAASESGTLATITTEATVNNTTGIESLNTFDATSLQEFTVTWVVDSASTPQGNGLLFAADSNTGLWGPSVYLKLNGSGQAFFSSTYDSNSVDLIVDAAITLADLTNGFTLSLTYNTNGVSWSQTGIASFHSTGTQTWDQLNGAQSFGYDEVFGSAVRVSAWNQTSDTTPNSMHVDRVTVIKKIFGLDDHFDNGDLATGGANAVNGGFKLVDNGVGTSGSATESGTLVTITTGTSVNNTTGIESLNTFDAASVDEFTVTWVVDSASTPEGNGLLFFADSDTGLWGKYSALQFNSAGQALFLSDAGNGQQPHMVDAAVTLSDLTGGFTLSLTCNTTGVSWTQTGIASFHSSGSRTWDQLNGSQTFGYSDVFDSTVHVSAWLQQTEFAVNSMSIDRVTVVGPPPGGTVIVLR